jgi:hypothetical protein
MKIGEYKQAMSHMLKKDNSLENFTFDPNAKLIDNDPEPLSSFATGGRVFLAQGTNPFYGGYIRQIGNKYYLTIGSDKSEFRYVKSYPTKKEAETDRKIQLDKINKIVQKEKQGYLTGPELVDYLKQERNIDVNKSSIARIAESAELESKPHKYGTGNSKLYKIPTEEELDKFKTNKLKQYASPEAQVLYDQRIERAKELLQQGKSRDETADIIKNEFKEISDGKSTAIDAANQLKEKGIDVISKKEGLSSTASTKVINNLNTLNQDEQLKNILSNPDFSLGKDLSKATDRIKQILPNSTDQTAERQLGQLLYEYSGKGPYNIKTDNPDLFNNANKLYFAEKGFGKPSSAIQRIGTEARVAEQIGKERTFFPNMRKTIGKYTPEGFSADEIKPLRSSDINKTGYYSLFSQGIDSDINADKGRTIDRSIGKAEKSLQNLDPDDPNYEQLRENIKNKYNKEVKEFTLKANANLKKGQLPVRGLEISFDHPEDSIVRYDELKKTHPELIEGIDNIYDEHGYSFKVPKDVKTVYENLDYLRTPQGQKKVTQLYEQGASRLYGEVFPGASVVSNLLENPIALNTINLTKNFSKATGLPVNAAFGAVLNSEEMRKKGLDIPETLIAGAGKGAIDDLFNFLSYGYRAPVALAKTVSEMPFKEKTNFDIEKFKENLGEDPVNIIGWLTDKYLSKKDPNEKLKNLTNFEWEKSQPAIEPDETSVPYNEFYFPDVTSNKTQKQIEQEKEYLKNEILENNPDLKKEIEDWNKNTELSKQV